MPSIMTADICTTNRPKHTPWSARRPTAMQKMRVRDTASNASASESVTIFLHCPQVIFHLITTRRQSPPTGAAVGVAHDAVVMVTPRSHLKWEILLPLPDTPSSLSLHSPPPPPHSLPVPSDIIIFFIITAVVTVVTIVLCVAYWHVD